MGKWLSAVVVGVALVVVVAPPAASARPTFRGTPPDRWAPLTGDQTQRLVRRYLRRNEVDGWVTSCEVGRNHAACRYDYRDVVDVNDEPVRVVKEDALVEVQQGHCGRWVFDEFADDLPDFHRCY